MEGFYQEQDWGTGLQISDSVTPLPLIETIQMLLEISKLDHLGNRRPLEAVKWESATIYIYPVIGRESEVFQSSRTPVLYGSNILYLRVEITKKGSVIFEYGYVCYEVYKGN